MENSETIFLIERLVQLYDAQERYKELEPLLLLLLKAKEALFGSKHPNTIVVVNNLAWAYLEQGKAEALTYFKRCLVVWNQALDWKHQWIHLGIALYKSTETGSFQEVDLIIQELVSLLGLEHEYIQKARQKKERMKRR